MLGHVDAETGKAFVDVVLDQAEQKGTGRWTVQNALDLGVPITGIAEATFARALSGSVPQREAGQARLPGNTGEWNVEDRDGFVEDVRQALYASKVVAYSQGFDQIAAASAEFGWNIDRGAMARIWRGGCIIRARFLNRITEAYERDADLPLLLADDYFADAVGTCLAAWRRVVAGAAQNGIPTPAFSSSLAYYDGIRAERLPAALIQAQRDFFGAHTYRRVDKEGSYHTEWTADRSESDGLASVAIRRSPGRTWSICALGSPVSIRPGRRRHPAPQRTAGRGISRTGPRQRDGAERRRCGVLRDRSGEPVPVRAVAPAAGTAGRSGCRCS